MHLKSQFFGEYSKGQQLNGSELGDTKTRNHVDYGHYEQRPVYYSLN